MSEHALIVHVTEAGPNGKDSKVRVDAPLGDFGLPGMVLQSSQVRLPKVEHDKLPSVLGWSIDDRIRGEGARKGRVIAVWQGDTLVGACAWHLEDTGPPIIFDLGCRQDLPEDQARRVEAVLLQCLREISGHRRLRRDPTSLRWEDRPIDHHPDRKARAQLRGAIRQRADELGFAPMRKRPKRYRGKWVRERLF